MNSVNIQCILKNILLAKSPEQNIAKLKRLWLCEGPGIEINAGHCIDCGEAGLNC